MAKGITEIIEDFKILHPMAYKRIRKDITEDTLDRVINQIKKDREIGWITDEDDIESLKVSMFNVGRIKGEEKMVKERASEECLTLEEAFIEGYAQGRVDAIDEFVNELIKIDKTLGIDIIDVFEVADKLKEK